MRYKGIWIIKEIWLSGTIRFILKDSKSKCIPLNYDLVNINDVFDYIDTLDLDKQLVLV